jgi:phage gp36-like protein
MRKRHCGRSAAYPPTLEDQRLFLNAKGSLDRDALAQSVTNEANEIDSLLKGKSTRPCVLRIAYWLGRERSLISQESVSSR